MPEPGGQGGHYPSPPYIWQITLPYSNRNQIIPTYYYWHPQIFLPFRIIATQQFLGISTMFVF